MSRDLSHAHMPGLEQQIGEKTAVGLHKPSPEAALQKESLWQSFAKCGESEANFALMTADRPGKIAGDQGEKSTLEVSVPGFSGKLSIDKLQKPDIAQRIKLAEELDSALKEQTTYGQTDFLLPGIIAGAAFASKLNKPLAIGIGVVGVLAVKINNDEKLQAAQAKVNATIGRMPAEDARKFDPFRQDMSNSLDFGRNAYLPFGAYSVMAFLPGVKGLYSPAAHLMWASAAVGVDTYQSFVTRPMTYNKFHTAHEAWKKELRQL